jgi:hypothetical protein
VLDATVLHGAINSVGMLFNAAIAPEEQIWFALTSAVLEAAAFLLLDWRMWFTRPAAVPSAEAIPATA